MWYLLVRYVYVHVPNELLLHMGHDFYPGRASYLALSAAGHAEGTRVHHGANSGRGWAPWGVLWKFKVAKSDK